MEVQVQVQVEAHHKETMMVAVECQGKVVEVECHVKEKKGPHEQEEVVVDGVGLYHTEQEGGRKVFPQPIVEKMMHEEEEEEEVVVEVENSILLKVDAKKYQQTKDVAEAAEAILY